ncbi:MAG: hypothetical protein K9L75_02285 [Spirochaetia bacterium]|nr:hypothetical protein [Spirochaetia bacterium]
MGTLITAVCEKCGYRKDLMTLFSGMIGVSEHCFIPYYCKSCSTLFEGDMLEDTIYCPECNSKDVVSYEDESLGFSEDKTSFSWHVFQIGREVKLNEKGNLCPQCREFTLKFESVGDWD